MQPQEALAAWVERYRRAWESNEADDIRALFTEDADYRTDPWTTPWHGHDAIVAGWLERQDDSGSSTFQWTPLVATDTLSIVQGTTVYGNGPTYSNLWVVALAEDGRAGEFTEWWMDQSDPS